MTKFDKFILYFTFGYSVISPLSNTLIDWIVK